MSPPLIGLFNHVSGIDVRVLHVVGVVVSLCSVFRTDVVLSKPDTDVQCSTLHVFSERGRHFPIGFDGGPVKSSSITTRLYASHVT